MPKKSNPKPNLKPTQETKEADLEDLVQTIGSIGHQIQAIAKKDLLTIKRRIKVIISNNSRNIQEIESTLDTLLDYVPWNVGRKEFETLNNYYATINKPASKNYNQFLQKELK
jgi:hypothetical protein